MAPGLIVCEQEEALAIQKNRHEPKKIKSRWKSKPGAEVFRELWAMEILGEAAAWLALQGLQESQAWALIFLILKDGRTNLC